MSTIREDHDAVVEMIAGWLQEASPFGMPRGRRLAIAKAIAARDEMRSVMARPTVPFPIADGLCECGSDLTWRIVEHGIVRHTSAEYEPLVEHRDGSTDSPRLLGLTAGLSEYSDEGEHSYVECFGCGRRFLLPDGEDELQWS